VNQQGVGSRSHPGCCENRQFRFDRTVRNEFGAVPRLIRGSTTGTDLVCCLGQPGHIETGMTMRYIELFSHELVTWLQQWNASNAVYGFAAVLVAYIYLVFRRPC
jgi:hypothetical protein